MVMKLPGTPTSMKRMQAATANCSRASGYSASSGGDLTEWSLESLPLLPLLPLLLLLQEDEVFHQSMALTVASMTFDSRF